MKQSIYRLRIRSVPGNNVLPVSNSAMIHPTDQISTKDIKIHSDRNIIGIDVDKIEKTFAIYIIPVRL